MHWNKAWFQLSILMLLAFVWGSSFILMKVGLKSFTSTQAAAIRILLASLTLLPLAWHNLKALKKKDLPSLLVAGFIGSFIPAFLFTKAQTRIDSALAGMLNSLTPVFTLVIALLFTQIKVRSIQVGGVFLGLLGATALILSGKGISLSDINAYALLIVLATLFYGINVNVIKSTLTHLTGAQITSFSFMFLWPFALAILLSTDLTTAFTHPGWPLHLLALATLGIIGTSLAMLLMNSLIRYVSPIFTSSVTYVIPIFAIGWGVLDGEKISVHHLGGMAMILAGVYLIGRKKKEACR